MPSEKPPQEKPLESHFRRLEAIYRAAPCNAPHRLELEVSEGRAEVVLQVAPELLHTAGSVHGAFYFKLLDDAAFFSANSLVADVFVLTSSFNLNLLRPISTGTMRAAGRVVHRSRSHFIADAELADGAGNALARGTGTFVRSNIPLSDLGNKPR